MPSGHYFAVGDFYNLSRKGTLTAERLTVLPQFTVSADTTVHADERAADSKITVVTPRPAVAQETTFALLRHGMAGAFGFFHWTDTVPIWVSPVSRRPAIVPRNRPASPERAAIRDAPPARYWLG